MSPTEETCAPAFCVTLRRAFQLPRIPAHSAPPAHGRKREQLRAQREQPLLPASNLVMTNPPFTLHTANTTDHHNPHRARTPRPSVQQQQQHPSLTFKNAGTQAAEEEDQVLLDNHLLLHNVTPTLHSGSTLFFFSLSLSALLSHRMDLSG